MPYIDCQTARSDPACIQIDMTTVGSASGRVGALGRGHGRRRISPVGGARAGGRPRPAAGRRATPQASCLASPAARGSGAVAASALEKELPRVVTDHKKLVDAIIAGVPAEQVKDRMIELDAHRKELERQLSSTPVRDPLRIHPGMARTYRERIGQLILGLAEAERMDEAKEALRAVVEKIALVPVSAAESETGKPRG